MFPAALAPESRTGTGCLGHFPCKTTVVRAVLSLSILLLDLQFLADQQAVRLKGRLTRRLVLGRLG